MSNPQLPAEQNTLALVFFFTIRAVVGNGKNNSNQLATNVFSKKNWSYVDVILVAFSSLVFFLSFYSFLPLLR